MVTGVRFYHTYCRGWERQPVPDQWQWKQMDASREREHCTSQVGSSAIRLG